MGISQLVAPSLAGVLVTWGSGLKRMKQEGEREGGGEGLEIVLLVDLVTCVLAVSSVLFISIPRAISGTLLFFSSLLFYFVFIY